MALLVTQRASANTPLDWRGELADFIEAGMPEWNFARANKHDTCWPASAFINGDQQHTPVHPNNWPNTDSGCDPRGTAFPAYVSVKTCFGSEVRVIYTLYFPKDGFIGNGHEHDFEHVLVVWRYNGNNQWIRSALMTSHHGEERAILDWNRVQTKTNGVANRGGDHPRIFVGFSKHAMFNDQGGLKDIGSSLNDLEYRHADYASGWYEMPRVTDDNALAKQFQRYDWGHAHDNPARVSQQLCSLSQAAPTQPAHGGKP